MLNMKSLITLRNRFRLKHKQNVLIPAKRKIKFAWVVVDEVGNHNIHVGFFKLPITRRLIQDIFYSYMKAIRNVSYQNFSKPWNFQFQKLLHEGEIIPKWFGISYYEWNCDIIVCYPIPFNWIMWFWHDKLKYTLRFTPRDIELINAREKGYTDCYKDYKNNLVEHKAESFERGYQIGKEDAAHDIAHDMNRMYDKGYAKCLDNCR